MQRIKEISEFMVPTRIICGIGSCQKIGSELKKMEMKRVLLITDEHILQSDLLKPICDSLVAHNISFDIFHKVKPNPTVEVVEKAFSFFKKRNYSVLLAVGGGSVIDTAKAIGVLATNGGRIQDYDGTNKFNNPSFPIVSVPTTAGTGSEVSGSIVIIDPERGIKISVRNRNFIPSKIAVLDPLLLKSLPRSIAVASGMDALTHNLESFLSLRANPFTEGISLYGIKLISENLQTFVADRSNTQAAFAMLVAATMGGLAFTYTGTGNVHCMTRVICGQFPHIPHGLANAIVLPYVLEFNFPTCVPKFVQIAQTMGVNIERLTQTEAGAKAIEVIKKINKNLQIPAGLREVGVEEKAISLMAKYCAEAGYNRWNPRHTSYEDFVNLFKRSM